MRVLHYLELADHLDRSGIATAVDHQRRGLASTDVEVVSPPWAGGRLSTAASAALGGGRFLAAGDIVHCNMIGPGSLTLARAAKRSGLPLVLHAHVTKEDFAESFRGSTQVAPVLGRYLRWFYSQADLVLCPSQYTKRVLERYPVTAPIEPVSNGVDAAALEGHGELREPYRERYDLEGMVPFAVGSVFERKGLTTFCRLAQRTDFDFAWFGTYDEGPQASRAVRRWTRNPPSNLTFTGWVDDIRGAYGAGDVFLFPTKVENQGLVVLEAMACGKPVVLRRIPVFEEFYTHGEDCLLCETEAEFVDALERLASEPDLRERLGENAKETAAGHSLDRVGSELAGIYRKVTDRG